jgi:hypothetical protein
MVILVWYYWRQRQQAIDAVRQDIVAEINEAPVVDLRNAQLVLDETGRNDVDAGWERPQRKVKERESRPAIFSPRVPPSNKVMNLDDLVEELP